MSLVFSDLTTYKGVIQEYEREIGVDRGFISGNADRLKEATAGVNLAIDDYLAIALTASGKWQLDDSNFTKYPEVTTNLFSSQQDYVFTTDEEGALILDIYRVMVADTSGVFREIKPVDKQSDLDVSSFYDGKNRAGTPTQYDKTANGIFLDPIPNYNSTGGLKVYINREASYFVSTDTTKKPGFPGLHHRYFALKPALDYARRKNLTNLNAIQNEVFRMEQMIKDYFGHREKDVIKKMIPFVESNK
jgi:hypothetical protein